MLFYVIACQANVSDSSEIVSIDPTNDVLSLAQSVVWQSLESPYTTGADWADINGDGFMDLVVSEGNDMTPGHIRVYYNREGELEREASFETDTIAYYGHLAIGDLNGDGWADLASSIYLGEDRFDDPGGVAIFLNHEGQLSKTPDWEMDGFYSFSLALGDVDRDGDVDIAVAVGEVYTERTDTAFILCNDGTADFAVCWEDETPRYSVDVALVDLNRDQWLDLVFAHHGEGHSIRYGQSDLFSSSPDWQAQEDGFEGNTVDWGDINGDNSLDIVVSDNLQLGGAGRVRAWCGPEFLLCWESADPVAMQSALALRDLDLDGDADLVVGAWWGSVRVYEQDEYGLSTEPIFVSQEDDIVAEAFAWAPISNVSSETITGSGVLEIPDRRRVRRIVSGTFVEGYLFGENIEAEIFVNHNMRLVLSDWEPVHGTWMFASEPME